MADFFGRVVIKFTIVCQRINSSENAKFRVYQPIGLASLPQNTTLLSSVGGLAGNCFGEDY